MTFSLSDLCICPLTSSLRQVKTVAGIKNTNEDALMVTLSKDHILLHKKEEDRDKLGQKKINVRFRFHLGKN